MTNTDMEAKILVWYSKLQRHGAFAGLGKDFYNYTPPYLYLLSLATFTSAFIAPLTSVKIIAMIFDVFGAVDCIPSGAAAKTPRAVAISGRRDLLLRPHVADQQCGVGPGR